MADIPVNSNTPIGNTDDDKTLKKLEAAIIKIEAMDAATIKANDNLAKYTQSYRELNKELDKFLSQTKGMKFPSSSGGGSGSSGSKSTKESNKAEEKEKKKHTKNLKDISAAASKAISSSAISAIGPIMTASSGLVALGFVLKNLVDMTNAAEKRTVNYATALQKMGLSLNENQQQMLNASITYNKLSNQWSRFGDDIGKALSPAKQLLATIASSILGDYSTAETDERRSAFELSAVTQARSMAFSGPSQRALAGGLYDLALSAAVGTKYEGYESEVADKLAQAVFTGRGAEEFGYNVSDNALIGYMAKQGVDIVNVEITDAMKTAYRYQMLNYEATLGGADAISEQVKNWEQVGIEIDRCKGKLFSFDEVIQLAAVDTRIPEIEGGLSGEGNNNSSGSNKPEKKYFPSLLNKFHNEVKTLATTEDEFKTDVDDLKTNQDNAADKQDKAADKQKEAADKQDVAADKQKEAADKQDAAADKNQQAANDANNAADKNQQAADDMNTAATNMGTAATNMNNAADSINTAADNIANAMNDASTNIATAMNNAAENIGNAISEAASNAATTISNGITSGANTAAETLKNGVIAGGQQASNDISDAMKKAGNTVADNIKNSIEQSKINVGVKVENQTIITHKTVNDTETTETTPVEASETNVSDTGTTSEADKVINFNTGVSDSADLANLFSETTEGKPLEGTEKISEHLFGDVKNNSNTDHAFSDTMENKKWQQANPDQDALIKEGLEHLSNVKETNVSSGAKSIAKAYAAGLLDPFEVIDFLSEFYSPAKGWREDVTLGEFAGALGKFAISPVTFLGEAGYGAFTGKDIETWGMDDSLFVTILKSLGIGVGSVASSIVLEGFSDIVGAEIWAGELLGWENDTLNGLRATQAFADCLLEWALDGELATAIADLYGDNGDEARKKREQYISDVSSSREVQLQAGTLDVDKLNERREYIKNRISDTGSEHKGTGRTFASGGIGTKELHGASLFEGNKAEAVIPLESDIGIRYLSDAMREASSGEGMGNQIVVNLTLRGLNVADNEAEWQHVGKKIAEVIDVNLMRRGELNYGSSF